jgi:hypothetical protein
MRHKFTGLLAVVVVMAMVVPVLAGKAEPVPDEYYSLSWDDTTGMYSEFEHISMRDGLGSLTWSLDQDPWSPTPTGLAFDVDGTMYTTLNVFGPVEIVQSQFARVDAITGEVTLIGDPVAINTAGGDIDACGNYYATGFEIPALGYVWGDRNLYRIDKLTGEFLPIGDTSKSNWMDLAFDSEETLWATTENELWTLDTVTGAATFVTEIHGVPNAGEPYNLEVMSIAFDSHGDLYGTAMNAFYEGPDGSPVLKIDSETGETDLIGYTHQISNHGGDIMPKHVTVAHRQGQGDYKCTTIGMRDLDAHLAHGDYVPGSAGHSCECP